MPEKFKRKYNNVRKSRIARDIEVSLAVTFLILASILLFEKLLWFIAPTTPGERKDVVQVTGVLLAAIVGLTGLYFTLQNLRINQRTLQANLASTQQTLKLTEQGQITERFTRAIDQLGAAGDDGKKLEIRLGGIYALERIAKDSPERDYGTTVEVLTAYIRENAPWPLRNDSQQANGPAQQETSSPIRKPSADIQAVLNVLRRRKEDELPIDLQGTNLRGAIFSEVTSPGLELAQTKPNFRRARLTNANLQEASLQSVDLQRARLRLARLYKTNLHGADLRNADLRRTYLRQANLNGADLRDADLYVADLREANAQNADLREAQLWKANLRRADLREANFQGAYLYGADLRGADFEEANLQEADLRNADLRNTDLRQTNGLTQQQIEGASTDAGTRLPAAL